MQQNFIHGYRVNLPEQRELKLLTLEL